MFLLCSYIKPEHRKIQIIELRKGIKNKLREGTKGCDVNVEMMLDILKL